MARPEPCLTVTSAVGLTVGIVIGAGIFRVPSLVASNAASTTAMLSAWVVGGVVSLIGALVYAELATTYPHAGGDYHYLARAYGHRTGFLFAWARLTVIQTGSIALLSFVFGDYMTRIVPLGAYSSSIYAALLIVVLTTLNIAGVRQGTMVQNVLTTVEASGVLLVIVAGLFLVTPSTAPSTAAPATSAFGLMMVFVLLTYGGWNEAAYISAELRDVRRNMVRALTISLLLITTLYVLVNWAYVRALGLSGVAASEQVAADIMQRAFGPVGVPVMAILVGISALTSANSSIFTGARTSYAFGNDVARFRWLGRWHGERRTPMNALILQGAVALALVGLGSLDIPSIGLNRRGFETIVEYTAPVFWLFFLMTGLSVFVLRRKDAGISRPFKAPLYPLSPIIFCATCSYLLYSSLAYTGAGALVGVAVLAAGGLLLLIKPAGWFETR